MLYYVNGKQSNAVEVLVFVTSMAKENGYDLEEAIGLLMGAKDSEEARDMLFEMSGNRLEIVVE